MLRVQGLRQRGRQPAVVQVRDHEHPGRNRHATVRPHDRFQGMGTQLQGFPDGRPAHGQIGIGRLHHGIGDEPPHGLLPPGFRPGMHGQHGPQRGTGQFRTGLSHGRDDHGEGAVAHILGVIFKVPELLRIQHGPGGDGLSRCGLQLPQGKRERGHGAVSCTDDLLPPLMNGLRC